MLAQRSKFCQKYYNLGSSIFKSIGNDTIGLNWVILILHILILLLVLIAMDSGLLKFSFSFSFLTQPLQFDESILDNDVLEERHRILNLNYSATNKSPSNTDVSEEEQETDHLTVNDLVKRFPGRNTFAVNHLTFGAKRGEAFGLLGYN
ncbi:unnamed protein product, partial [Rotaria sp. Silwood1]